MKINHITAALARLSSYARSGDVYTEAAEPPAAVEPVPPVAAFSGVVSGNNITLTDESTADDSTIVSWLWDFHDGTTSTLQHPVFAYTLSPLFVDPYVVQPFEITLTVTDSNGATDSVTQFVDAPAYPVAAYSHVADGLEVTFTDLSTVDGSTIVSWSWDFGGFDSSSEQNPTFTFPTPGFHEVNVTVTSADGKTSSGGGEIEISDITWYVDATSGWSFPSTIDEVTDFLAYHGLSVAVPDTILGCQDPASPGTLVDVGTGGCSMAVTGTVLHQRPITGHSRLAFEIGSTANNSHAQASNVFANMATTSGALFAMVKLPSTVAAGDAIISMGDMPIQAGLNVLTTGGALRYRNVNLANGSADHRSVLRPMAIVHNVTALTSQAFTDLEKLSATYAACTDDHLALGAVDNGAAHATGTQFALAWAWKGAKAETCTAANMKALFTALTGNTIPWTP